MARGAALCACLAAACLTVAGPSAAGPSAAGPSADAAAQGARETLRVGVYENAPKLAPADDGGASGFFGDLTPSLAAAAGLDVEWVPCTWPGCLDLLAEGRLDVMPDVAWTAERAQRFRFGDQPALYSWSEFYTRPDSRIETMDDLAGRRLAVLEGSFQEGAARDYFARLGLEVAFVLGSAFPEVLAAVAGGRADAALVNVHYGRLHAAEHGLVEGSGHFAISPLYFAYSAAVPDAVVRAMDLSLFLQQTDPSSDYRRAFDRWIAPRLTETLAPGWMAWALCGLTLGLLGLAVVVVLVRREVRRRGEALAEMRLQALTAHHATTLGTTALGFTHDFGNVLTVLRSALAELRARFTYAMSGEALQILADAEAANAAGLAITRRLGALATEGSAELDWIDLAEALAAMEGLLRRSVPAAIDLAIEAAPGIGPVMAERSRLENAVLNLVLNAVAAMPEGGRLLLAADRGPDGRPRLTCTDTGQGMAPAVAARAAEPFFTTRPGRGSGLGLAAVDAFIRGVGGELRIDSAEGEGTTVALWFPDDDATRDWLAATVPGAPSGRILLVEDDPRVRRAVARQLAALGWDVRETGSADAALALLAGGEVFDAVLADMHLPGILQGGDLSRAARDVPVVLMTADPEARGPFGVPLLRKPVALPTLAMTLAAFRRAPRRSVAAARAH